MTGAARFLGRTQSAVSRLISDLEGSTGLILFERSGARLYPTQAGLSMYDEVRHSYVGLQNIVEKARQLAAGVSVRRLTLGATPALSGGLLSSALTQVVGTQDMTQAVLSSMTSESVIKSVADGVLDLGLATLPIDIADTRLHWIGEAPCVAVLAEDDPLAAREAISLAELTSRRILTVGNPFRLRRTIDAALKANSLTLTAPLETNTSLNAVMAARNKLGVAIVEPVTAHAIPVRGVVIRPILEYIPSVWGVITPAFRPLPPMVETLIEAVESVATNLLPGFVRHPPEELNTIHTRLFRRDPDSDDSCS
ncbi:LysR family transcriptional regulator (plasmid) [Kozakia baliensis]|uniref:LysR family transcriptional regulator n=4 Tax=Kozakia baliensis TaxID=153496 RepID=A0A1D8UY51_9PROT|nr:LysR family transcriptional regulator [Kozakia baliensis]